MEFGSVIYHIEDYTVVIRDNPLISPVEIFGRRKSVHNVVSLIERLAEVMSEEIK